MRLLNTALFILAKDEKELKCLAVGTVPIYYGTSIQLNLTVVRWDNLKKNIK